MKRIFLLIGLILLLQNSVFANQTVTGSIQMSDVQVYSEDGKFGLKDLDGNIVVEPDYKKMIRLGNTSWIVQKRSKFGLMDSSGNYLIKPKYRHVARIFGKYVKLGNDNDFGLYDETGKTIVRPEYSSIDPLFGQMFLTCKNFKYGIVDVNGRQLLENKFDDIYMPTPTTMRIQYNGAWYEIERWHNDELIIPPNVQKITIDNQDFRLTSLISNPGAASGYSVLTATDYFIKIFSSISPAYEDTIDDLMLSQGAETVNIFMKMSWLPKFPYTYLKKYINNLRSPNNGPLSDKRNQLKQEILEDSTKNAD